MPTFMSVGRREDKTTTFFFFSWILMQSFRIQLHKICQHLPTTWTKWNKRDKVWSRANLLFKLRFRSRRRPCCLSALLDLNLGLKNSNKEGKQWYIYFVSSRNAPWWGGELRDKSKTAARETTCIMGPLYKYHWFILSFSLCVRALQEILSEVLSTYNCWRFTRPPNTFSCKLFSLLLKRYLQRKNYPWISSSRVNEQVYSAVVNALVFHQSKWLVLS